MFANSKNSPFLLYSIHLYISERGSFKYEKPENIQSVLEKLYYLKLQAKGPVSMFVRKSHIVLCINNSHYYQEVEIKNPIDESIVKDYRKDVSMVLSFINSLVKE